jgi:hypothetical protein
MKYWEKFKSHKERGEWVELQFMAAAAQRRFAVSKPWGDTKPYDVGIEHEGNYLRVQVKSTTMRSGAGYLCQFHPNHQRKQDYSLKEIDVFAAYVIPENVWYLIPAALLLGKRRKWITMLCPLSPPKKKACYCWEVYRENWKLLTKSRRELLQPEGDHNSALKTPPAEKRREQMTHMSNIPKGDTGRSRRIKNNPLLRYRESPKAMRRLP